MNRIYLCLAFMIISTVLVSYFTGYLIDKVNHPVQRYVIGKLFNATK